MLSAALISLGCVHKQICHSFDVHSVAANQYMGRRFTQFILSLSLTNCGFVAWTVNDYVLSFHPYQDVSEAVNPSKIWLKPAE